MKQYLAKVQLLVLQIISTTSHGSGQLLMEECISFG